MLYPLSFHDEMQRKWRSTNRHDHGITPFHELGCYDQCVKFRTVIGERTLGRMVTGLWMFAAANLVFENIRSAAVRRESSAFLSATQFGFQLTEEGTYSGLLKVSFRSLWWIQTCKDELDRPANLSAALPSLTHLSNPWAALEEESSHISKGGNVDVCPWISPSVCRFKRVMSLTGIESPRRYSIVL